MQVFANSGYPKTTYGDAVYLRFRDLADANLRELTQRLPVFNGSPAAISYAS